VKLEFSKRHAAFVSLWLVGVVVVDQLVKAWARAAAEGLEGRIIYRVIPNVFELKLVYNKGIAFGMAQGGGVLLTPIAVLVMVAALWMTLTKAKETRLFHVTMVALAAGALGNLIDRLRFGQVTDMFYIRLIDFPVFNVADVSITLAGCLLVYSGLVDMIKPRKESAAPSET
jgi:signal peptidase II